MSARAGGDLDYACARISACYGARADEAAWRRVETVREFKAMLDVARTTALAPWTAGISADADTHAHERTLRAHWRAHAAGVATWMPELWRPAIEWSALVFELPVLDQLRQGQSLRRLADDPLYRKWLERTQRGEPVDDRLATLMSAPDADALLRAWLDEWRRSLPAAHEREAPTLAKLAQVVTQYAADMRHGGTRDGGSVVRALRERLDVLYRRAVLEPTAAFVYLGLVALDLARLRGEIARRVLFPRWMPA